MQIARAHFCVWQQCSCGEYTFICCKLCIFTIIQKYSHRHGNFLNFVCRSSWIKDQMWQWVRKMFRRESSAFTAWPLEVWYCFYPIVQLVMSFGIIMATWKTLGILSFWIILIHFAPSPACASLSANVINICEKIKLM